jgi:spore coat polysaccharide biosynthesis predicted glycosyltransferase SpsG
VSPTPTLVMRCDLGASSGVGHLMRCIALAEEFAARGSRVVFSAAMAEVPFAQEQLRSRGFAWVDPPAGTPEDHLVQLREIGADIVAVDSYHLPPAVYSGIRSTHTTLAVVDGDPAGREADVFLDQNLGAEQDVWPLPPGAVRLAGLDYALMRDEVRRARPVDTHRHVESEPLRLFAFFGGTDAFGAAPDVTRAVLATGRPVTLRVVGATESIRAKLVGLDLAPGQVVDVIEPTSALASEVVAADLVVSAAGTSSWELLCLGAACAFLCVADNQQVSYERITTLGTVAGLGRLERVRADPQDAVRQLGRLLDDPAERDRLRTEAGRLVDGQGRVRVAEAVLEQWRQRAGHARLI